MRPLPKFYISYGMPKSGSTLAFEFTRTMLEMAGVHQATIPCPAIPINSPINFVKTFDKPTFTSLQQSTGDLTGPCVIKTHSRLFPAISKQLHSGQLIGHAVCRDPRDIALSMLDAAREGRAWGNGPNGPFRHIKETIPRIRTQVNHFLAWASCKNILTLHYEQIAFDSESAVARIAAQLGIDKDPLNVIHKVINERFTQKNRAFPQRWKSEMPPSDAAMIYEEFADFIDTYCLDIPTNPVIRTPRKSWFSRVFAGNKQCKPSN